MRDKWVQEQWDDLCRRTLRSAEHWGHRAPRLAETIRFEAEEFTRGSMPERYPDLLDRVREASRLAVDWSERTDSRSTNVSDAVDEAVSESFPASDRPA